MQEPALAAAMSKANIDEDEHHVEVSDAGIALPPPRRLEDLSADDVARLLTTLGHGKYASLCLSTPLTGRDLSHCCENDLEAIGIAFRPHRLSILELVSGLRAGGVPGVLLDACSGEDGAELPVWLASAEQDLMDDAAGESASTGNEPAWLVDAESQLGSQPADSATRLPQPGRLQEPPPQLPTQPPPPPPPPLQGVSERLMKLAEAADSQQGGTVVVPKRMSASTDPQKLAPAACLEVHYAPDRGSIRILPTDVPFVVGRSPPSDWPREAQLVLSEPFISAKQCVVLPPEPSGITASSITAFRLLDTSTNGTFVNGVLVGKDSMCELSAGDRLHFGMPDVFPYATFAIPTSPSRPAFTPPWVEPPPETAWRLGDWEGATTAGHASDGSQPKRTSKQAI